MMFKKLSIIILAVVFIFAGFWTLIPEKAQAITANEIRTQIAALQAQIAQLQQQLIQIESGSGQWCHTFNVNLRIGDRGDEVDALQLALGKDGDLVYDKNTNGVFDEYCASAVVGFQQKYKDEILSPWGLAYGTGFVGSTTRTKLNKLYGCIVVPQKCVQEGGMIGSSIWSGSPGCCPGLTSIYHIDENNGICGQPATDVGVCAYCGNGVCGKGENKCNCPQDCKETASKHIIVYSPTSGQAIKSPVVISGKAVSFESQFNVRIKDANGKILANTGVMGGVSYGDPAPFSVQVDYTAPSAKNGTLEVFDVSAVDGSEIQKTTIPVIFGDYQESISCTDSDGGKDYFTKGTADDGITIGEDVCDFTVLKERYCDSELKFATESYTCPSGCENGACKKE